MGRVRKKGFSSLGGKNNKILIAKEMVIFVAFFEIFLLRNFVARPYYWFHKRGFF